MASCGIHARYHSIAVAPIQPASEGAGSTLACCWILGLVS
jgi:hypothetical protein